MRGFTEAYLIGPHATYTVYRNSIPDVFLVEVPNVEVLLENHASIRRHPNGTDGEPLSIDLDQEISLTNEGAWARPHVDDVFYVQSPLAVVDATLGVVRGDGDVVRTFIPSKDTYAIAKEAIVERLLVGVLLQARAGFSYGLS